MLINIFKGIALFGLLGPVIGLLAVALPVTATTGNLSFGSLALLVPAAYLAGGIPAAACGLFIGMARSRLHGVWGYAFAGAVGAVCSASYYLLVSIRGDFDLDRVAALFGLAGFVAGLVCIAFLKPPNNSFKPKPLRGSA